MLNLPCKFLHFPFSCQIALIIYSSCMPGLPNHGRRCPATCQITNYDVRQSTTHAPIFRNSRNCFRVPLRFFANNLGLGVSDVVKAPCRIDCFRWPALIREICTVCGCVIPAPYPIALPGRKVTCCQQNQKWPRRIFQRVNNGRV